MKSEQYYWYGAEPLIINLELNTDYVAEDLATLAMYFDLFEFDGE